MLARFAGFWKDLGFTGEVLVDVGLVREHGLASCPDAHETGFEALIDAADAFVLDFGPVIRRRGDAIAHGHPERHGPWDQSGVCCKLWQREHQRWREGRALRQIIAINAINNVFESGIMSHVSVALTPFSTRMRHGFVMPPVQGEMDWMSRLLAGHAGAWDGSQIRSRKEAMGVVIHGPYRHLHVGTYRIKIETVRASPVRSRRRSGGRRFGDHLTARLPGASAHNRIRSCQRRGHARLRRRDRSIGESGVFGADVAAYLGSCRRGDFSAELRARFGFGIRNSDGGTCALGE